MVNIYCDSNRCEYDIRALVMAFFPYTDPKYHIVPENVIPENDEQDPHDGTKEDADICTDTDICADTDICISMHERNIHILCKSGDRESAKEYTFDGDPDTKRYRDELKRLLYTVLGEVTESKLPWGTLTGVRPVKLALKGILAGQSEAQVTDYMKEEYFCSDAKASLCTQIAVKEADILKKAGFYDGFNIYIGIPFCPTVCNYCSFSSMSLANMDDPDELILRYMEALKRECECVAELFSGRKLTSIYVGGGTPTALSEGHLGQLMYIICDCFDTGQAAEFCVEAGRPDTINEEKLRILRSAGANRISVNPQTMNDKTLVSIGRCHTAEQTVYAYNLARKAGFDNINMDIIAGLATEDTDDFAYTLDSIGKLRPDSFTVHSLVVKRASAYRQIRENRGRDEYKGKPVRKPIESMLCMASEYANKNGYKPYYMYRQKNKAGLSESPVLENVGYAKEGKESIYNVIIMEEKQTVAAVGAGAQSKLVNPYDPYSGEVTGIIRNSNVKNVYEYIDRIDEMIERKKRWFGGQGIN